MTARDIFDTLTAAHRTGGTKAAVAAAKAMVPVANTTIEWRPAGNPDTGNTPAWKLTAMSGGTSFKQHAPVANPRQALSDLARLVHTAREHYTANGYTLTAPSAAAPPPASAEPTHCRACRGHLTHFDLEASAVHGLHFNCA
jgi:hypothetical protein